VGGDTLPVALLVQVRTGLLTVHDVDDELEAAGNHFDLARRLGAGQDSAPHRQSLLGPPCSLRALVDPARLTELGQQVDQRGTPGLGTGRQELTDEEVRVPIDDQPRQAIGFGKYEPAGRVGIEHAQSPPRLDRPREAGSQESHVDGLAPVESPEPHANLRCRRVRSASEPLAGVGDHVDRVSRARQAVDALDRSREHPRMPPEQRLFAPVLEPDFGKGCGHRLP
jgi:hypothetical protein